MFLLVTLDFLPPIRHRTARVIFAKCKLDHVLSYLILSTRFLLMLLKVRYKVIIMKRLYDLPIYTFPSFFVTLPVIHHTPAPCSVLLQDLCAY